MKICYHKTTPLIATRSILFCLSTIYFIIEFVVSSSSIFFFFFFFLM